MTSFSELFDGRLLKPKTETYVDSGTIVPKVFSRPSYVSIRKLCRIRRYIFIVTKAAEIQFRLCYRKFASSVFLRAIIIVTIAIIKFLKDRTSPEGVFLKETPLEQTVGVSE